jgi:predicted amidohydrolase YtcJ
VATSTFIRGIRLVPVRTASAPDSPVDIRIDNGIVAEIGRDLRPRSDDHVLDAAGRWAIPGLWDAHVHLTAWSQARAKLDVSGTAGAAEVARIVADHVACLPAPWQGGAIIGYGFRPATWPTAPTVAELDAVSGAHPVILGSADIHTGWLNSKALALLGVEPRTGPLLESEWFDLQPAVARLTAAGGDADLMLRAAVADAAAVGVVGVVDFEMAANHLDWPRRFDAGIDQLRVRPVTYAEHLDDAIAAGLRTGATFPSGHGLLTQGSLKIFSDGSLNTRTAYCCEPYADAYALESPRGRRVYTLPELEDLLTRGRRGGFDIALHAIGDAAVDQALTAFDSTGTRGSIEHAQLIRLEDIARMRALGIRASVQPAHLLDDRDVTDQCWPDRADRCFALRSMLDGGVELALGSDAPVSPLDPWVAMAAAVHRATGDDTPWNPAESLTVEQALAASTDGQGTIGVGSRGDVVLVDDNPLKSTGSTAEAAHLLTNIGVAATVAAGRVTHLAM